MLKFFTMDNDGIRVFGDDARVIAAFNAYGFLDPQTMEPLGVYFAKGAADAAILDKYWQHLDFERIDGFDIGCGIVQTQAGPSLIATIEDEDDGWVLLTQITDYGFDDGHLSVSLYDGDEEHESLYELVRWDDGEYSLTEM